MRPDFPEPDFTCKLMRQTRLFRIDRVEMKSEVGSQIQLGIAEYIAVIGHFHPNDHFLQQAQELHEAPQQEQHLAGLDNFLPAFLAQHAFDPVAFFGAAFLATFLGAAKIFSQNYLPLAPFFIATRAIVFQ